jgi:glycosyltransferase involved in cell wall biosynthesis
VADPRVTVLMPTWNAGPFIRAAVDSVLAQTIEDWRLLVVDDQSSDGTPDVVASYDDPRVRLERLPRNLGQTGALNHGLGLIDTPWVARLDQDDVAMPARLERQLAYVAGRPATTLVGSWADFVDEHDRKLGSFRPATDAAEVRRQLYARSLPIAHSTAMMRTDAVHDLGGYATDFSIAQDYELWSRLAARGEVANVGEVLVLLRHHSGQASGSYASNLRQIREQLRVMDRLPELLGLEDRERSLWAARRLRLTTQLAYVGMRAGERDLARGGFRESAALVRREPRVAVTLARTGAERAARLTADAVGRARLRYRRPA